MPKYISDGGDWKQDVPANQVIKEAVKEVKKEKPIVKEPIVEPVNIKPIVIKKKSVSKAKPKPTK